MLTLEPIGHIQSCWPEKFGTPRQGSVVPSSTAELVLAPGALDGAASADGLAAFSHVWLVWHVHLNEGSAPSAKVQAPHLRGGRAGVFATRSPFRPNPLGLSLVRLLSVEGDTLRLAGVDLVDGTPVIDIKPYIPSYDAPGADEDVRTADWVDPPPLPVRLAPQAEADVEAAVGRGATPLLSDAASLCRALVQTLAADPRPLYRWRRERGAGGAEYDVALDGHTARCRFELDTASGAESVCVLRFERERGEAR